MTTRNIVPRANAEGNIGTSLKNWLKGWFQSIFVSGNLTDGTNNITIAQSKSSYDHIQIISGNPHNVTKFEVGLDNVTNDAQLKREAGDINSFVEKTIISDNDIVIIEDSENTYIKKKAKILNIADMKKAIYDTNNNNIVDNSESLVRYYAESEEIDSTTSLTYLEKLKLTTPSIPAGTYKLDWCCSVANSNGDRRVEVKIELNDTTIINELMKPKVDGTDFTSLSGFKHISLTAGVHFIDMDYRALANTASIRRARIELSRVS
jgi:hypothetical protein